MQLYDDFAQHYDYHRTADVTIATHLWLLAGCVPEGRYLDLACGTGNYTLALAGFGGNWFGLDPSIAMLERARTKSTRIGWTVGLAEVSPFLDSTFDAIITVLSIHHYADMTSAFREIRRLLGPCGTFATFACCREQTAHYWIWHYFPDYKPRYLATLPTQEAMMESLREAGFSRIASEPYWVDEGLQDGFLYSGKLDPRVYLDESRRAAMSTFSMLPDDRLYREGVKQLAMDTASGVWRSYLADADKHLGDYLYICAS